MEKQRNQNKRKIFAYKMGRRRLTNEEREASKKRQIEKTDVITERSSLKDQKKKYTHDKLQELEKVLAIFNQKY